MIKGTSSLTRSASCDIPCPVPGNRPAMICGLGRTQIFPVDHFQDHRDQGLFEVEERSLLFRVPP
jgi:hypothetical protein